MKSDRKPEDAAPSQLSLDLKARKDQPPPASADVVPISKQRTSTTRDVLIGDLIASKVPKKP